MADANEVIQWRGRTAVGADGGKLGKIEEIYLDTETDRPEWALVHTGLFGGKSSFMPLRDARSDGEQVTVPYTKDQVKDAPQMNPGADLSQPDEAALYSHYGIDYGESRSDSGLPEGGGTAPRQGRSSGSTGNDVSGRETDDAMTRSEEEMRVGTESSESGRARLRKYVVTENVETTVPVSREEVRVTREPITDANVGDAMDGPAISEEEHEVVLHEERPVVSKEAVPKERVRMGKESVTEQRQVSGEVRKEEVEQVDAEGQPAEGVDGARGTDEGVGR